MKYVVEWRDGTTILLSTCVHWTCAQDNHVKN